MTVITRPTQLSPSSCILTMSTNQRVSASPFGGSEQAVDMLNDRWLMSLEVDARDFADAAYIEAFVNSLRGQVNTVALHHFARPAPRGTMRGTLTLSAGASQGSGTLNITGGSGQASKTLLAGDMLGCGGLLLMVASDATANGSGVITVNLTNRVRTLLASAATVAWDKPTANFRMVGNSGVQYGSASSEAMSFDFAEKI
jgi:hypothetical protein